MLDGPGQGHPWPHNPFGLWGLGGMLVHPEALRLRLPKGVEEAVLPITLMIKRKELILLKPFDLLKFLIHFSLAILKGELDLSGERGERGELVVRERGRGGFFDGGDEGEDVSGINHAQNVPRFRKEHNKKQKQKPCQTQIFLRLDVIVLDTRPGAALAPQPFRAVGFRLAPS